MRHKRSPHVCRHDKWIFNGKRTCSYFSHLPKKYNKLKVYILFICWAIGVTIQAILFSRPWQSLYTPWPSEIKHVKIWEDYYYVKIDLIWLTERDYRSCKIALWNRSKTWSLRTFWQSESHILESKWSPNRYSPTNRMRRYERWTVHLHDW